MVEAKVNNLEEIIKIVEEKKIPLHKISEITGSENLATVVRRLIVERRLGVKLPAIASTILDFDELVGKNIENPIGAVQIPLGIAGPLLVKGDYAQGEFYIPLATTEGALVASVNRGCKAVTESGGVKVKIIYDGMTRAPCLWTPSVYDAVNLVKWVLSNIETLRRLVKEVTRHGELIGVDPYLVGNIVWLRFTFTTGDAMGMNMVTIATDRLLKYIEEHYPGEVKTLALSGNMCVDKKPAVINLLKGRGKTVIAEAVVKRSICLEVLKASPEEIDLVNRVKNLLGSARAGSISFNAHFANIIAAIFIATGQDVAQVVESSLGYTWTEVRGEDLYISVTLPSLEVGTVGGGTRLPTQREALRILGVEGGGNPPGVNAKKFAEIVAAAVLAGELSLLAALAAGHLAKAHIRLGRGGLSVKPSR